MGGNSSTGVGGQFINAMLDGYDPKNIWKYATIPTPVAEDKNVNPYPTTLHQVAYSSKPVLSSLNYWKCWKNNADNCAAEIIEIIEKQAIELVWIVLNSAAQIQIAAKLSTQIKVPFVAHIWDTPEYLAKSVRLDGYTKKHLIQQFTDVMQCATRGVTVSSSMSKIYKQRYGIDSIPMVFCPPKKSWRSVTPSNLEASEFNIVFAGSLYAFREWNSFLNAVAERNNQGNHPKINVTCVGNISRFAKKKDWVNYLPLKPIEEAATIVNNADVAYLPYWMDKKHAYFVQTAFPGKMSFYVASGTPVFFHGPKVSTPTDFLNEYEVGKYCHSYDSKDIMNTLDEILNSKFQKQYVAAQAKTLEAVFHPNRCIEKFNKTISLSCNIRQIENA